MRLQIDIRILHYSSSKEQNHRGLLGIAILSINPCAHIGLCHSQLSAQYVHCWMHNHFQIAYGSFRYRGLCLIHSHSIKKYLIATTFNSWFRILDQIFVQVYNIIQLNVCYKIFLNGNESVLNTATVSKWSICNWKWLCIPAMDVLRRKLWMPQTQLCATRIDAWGLQFQVIPWFFPYEEE